MKTTTSPPFASFAHHPALATPALDEAERTRLGRELENYLAPLVAYCEAQPADDGLSLAEFRHGHEVRQALAAFVRYETHTEQLLAHYRTALAHAQQQAAAQVPSLEQALGLPAPVASRFDHEPLYRLGWVRGCRQGIATTEQRYEHLVSLYAQYAVLVPPPGYHPSPLVQQAERHLANTALVARTTLPEETRQALASITLDHLPRP